MRLKQYQRIWLPPDSIPIPQVFHVQFASPDIAQFGPVPNIGTIAFDTQQDILWVGNNYVRTSMAITLRFTFVSH